MKVGTSGTKPEGGGGRFVDKPGKYHLMIKEVKLEEAGNSGSQVLRYPCEVVGGEHEDQIGKEVDNDLFLPEGSNFPEDNASKILRFACALGLYNTAQWKADQENGVEADLPMDEAAGLQFGAKIEMKPDKTDKEKFWARITRVYAVGDDEMQGVPMSKEHLQLFGGQLPRSDGNTRPFGNGSAGKAATAPAGPATTAPTQQAAQQPQPAASQGGGSDDDLF